MRTTADDLYTAYTALVNSGFDPDKISRLFHRIWYGIAPDLPRGAYSSCEVVDEVLEADRVASYGDFTPDEAARWDAIPYDYLVTYALATFEGGDYSTY